jgi:DNA-binding transcriptional MerR regulator
MNEQAAHSDREILMKIGDVARLSGVGIEALRFYESRGLLDPAGRTGSGYRLYDASALDRLTFIKKAQSVGFTLDEIARLIGEAKGGRRPCAEVRQLATERLAELDRRLAEMRRYRRELKQTLDAWDQQGEADGVICGLIEGLDAATMHPPGKPKAARARKAAARRSS